MNTKRICAWHPLYFGVPLVMEEGDEPASHGTCKRCESRLELERVRAIAQPYLAAPYIRLADEKELIDKLGGKAIYNDGVLFVILVPLKNGDVIGINDQSVCLYERKLKNETIEDIFWKREPAAVEYI